MARGKIEIKRIENTTNRQVTYSKRRNGLFKKANELTVLCDAKVSIIMFSSTNKLQEYITPGITTKQVYDQYQQISGIDVWSSQYEKMQEKLRQLREVNNKLRTDIRQRMGATLNDLSFTQLLHLEEEIENSLVTIRERKFKHLTSQIETSKKKGRNAGEIHRDLVHRFVSTEGGGEEDPRFGLVDNGAEYEYTSFFGFSSNRDSRVFSLEVQASIHPNLQNAAGSELTTFALLE